MIKDLIRRWLGIDVLEDEVDEIYDLAVNGISDLGCDIENGLSDLRKELKNS